MLYAIVWCALLCLVYADNGTNFDGAAFRYVSTNRTVKEEGCRYTCISKCCPGTQVLDNNTENCVENVYGIKLQDLAVDIYDKDFSKTKKPLKDFTLVHSEVFNDPNYTVSVDLPYLFENGEMFNRRPNYLEQWSGPYSYKTFCVEAQLNTGADNSVISTEVVYKELLSDYNLDESTKSKDAVLTAAMLISCFFLLLVLAAYAVLPQKRNLPSIMLMAYVACLATAFLVNPLQLLIENSLDKSECVAMGLIVYYTFLASFTWLNVMSYDMWTTTCKPLGPNWNPRREVLAKFGWYSVYGFGAPLLMTGFLVGIDSVDLTAVPGFVKPHFVFGSEFYCGFENEDERKLYVNAPIMVATAINIVFFVLTGRYIWRNSARPGGSGDSRNTKKDQSRFIIYLKLTLVMGVNWTLDVVSAFTDPDSWVWYLPDVFNALTGFFIFLIFVCKKDMIILLCKRFSIENRFTRQLESTVDTSISVSKRHTSDKDTTPSYFTPDGFSTKVTME